MSANTNAAITAEPTYTQLNCMQNAFVQTIPAQSTYLQNSPQQNGETEKERRLREYRSRLDQLIATLTVKYNLPPLAGAAKQIPWANDIRIKFIDAFDKKIKALPSNEIQAVFAQIIPQNTARWWIDRKDAPFEELVIYAKTVGTITAQNQVQIPRVQTTKIIDSPLPNPPMQYLPPQNPTQPWQMTTMEQQNTHYAREPSQQNLENCIVIDTRDSETILIHAKNPETIRNLMQQKGFVIEQNIWTKHQPKTDEKRTPMIESICLRLLADGYLTKVLTAPEPEPPHEGTVRIIDGKLCIDTKTTHLWKAASAIGTKRIWLDTARKEEIKSLIGNYDVVCTKEAELHLRHLGAV